MPLSDSHFLTADRALSTNSPGVSGAGDLSPTENARRSLLRLRPGGTVPDPPYKGCQDRQQAGRARPPQWLGQLLGHRSEVKSPHTSILVFRLSQIKQIFEYV